MERTLEQMLAFHCAPALAGLKPANLVCCDPALYPEMDATLTKLERELAAQGIHFRRMCRCRDRVLLLTYRQQVMEQHLRQPMVQTYLLEEGYPIGEVEAVLQHLERNLAAEEFPHEVGIILGYPPEDVEGFRRERGRNCKLSGYWKVYGDEVRARALFAQFTRCRRAFCTLLEQGLTLSEPIHAA